jgi:hypothetical protein
MKAKRSANLQEPAFELALRIRHPSMDPAQLSRELGFEATHSFRAGQPRPPVGDALAASVYGESYWLGSIDQTSWLSDAWLSGFGNIEAAVQKLGRAAAWKNLGSVLAMITRGLVRTHTPLFERIRAEGGQVSLLVQLSPLAVDGFSLTPEVSRQFGDLGITIEFEMTSD